jgi:hypothetical protein
MYELKPCKCGCKNIRRFKTFSENNASGFYACCADCARQTKVYMTMQEAIDAWNKEVE